MTLFAENSQGGVFQTGGGGGWTTKSFQEQGRANNHSVVQGQTNCFNEE